MNESEKQSCNWVAKEQINTNVNMVAPFEFYVKEMRALLGADPDVTVLHDSKKQVINICVAGCDKPDAYRLFFPGEIDIPGIGTVKILVNEHGKSYKTVATLNCLKEMLANHPLVKEIKATYIDDSINRIFVIFRNKPLQFKSDNFGSPWSVTTTTPEQAAKDVMDGSGMVVCWTTESDFSLEEWTPDHPFGK